MKIFATDISECQKPNAEHFPRPEVPCPDDEAGASCLVLGRKELLDITHSREWAVMREKSGAQLNALILGLVLVQLDVDVQTMCFQAPQEPDL